MPQREPTPSPRHNTEGKNAPHDQLHHFTGRPTGLLYPAAESALRRRGRRLSGAERTARVIAQPSQRRNDERGVLLVVRCRQVAQQYAIDARTRSEEHTSELQSLIRLSYAVFCLKKKNQ